MSKGSSASAAPRLIKQSVGLIGAGRMGTGIGISLLRQQRELHIKVNKKRFGADRLISAGAREHTSIAE